MPDPISLQVFHNLFASVAEEMGVALPSWPCSTPCLPATRQFLAPRIRDYRGMLSRRV